MVSMAFVLGQDYRILKIYIYYTPPELRIKNSRFRSGKGAEPLLREQGGASREQGGSTMGLCRGCAGGSLN